MNDDQLLLANAYVDGAVTAEERARAEGDAVVMAEVERLRSVRDALRAVDPPDDARREQAIAAALASFTQPRVTAPAASPSGLPVPGDRAALAFPAPAPAANGLPGTVAPPVSLAGRRRRRWLEFGAAAAAAIAVVGGGVALTRGGPDNSGDDAATASEDRTAEAAPSQAADANDAVAATEHADGAAPPAPDTDDPELNMVEPADLARLTDTDDLAAFVDSAPMKGAETASATDASGTSRAAAPTCTGGDYVGTAVYVVSNVDVTVEVFIDGGDAVARNATTCTDVARIPLP